MLGAIHPARYSQAMSHKLLTEYAILLSSSPIKKSRNSTLPTSPPESTRAHVRTNQRRLDLYMIGNGFTSKPNTVPSHTYGHIVGASNVASGALPANEKKKHNDRRKRKKAGISKYCTGSSALAASNSKIKTTLMRTCCHAIKFSPNTVSYTHLRAHET